MPTDPIPSGALRPDILLPNWQPRPFVLALLELHTQSLVVLRLAQRMAAAEGLVLVVGFYPPEGDMPDNRERERLLSLTEKAREMGAELLTGSDASRLAALYGWLEGQHHAGFLKQLVLGVRQHYGLRRRPRQSLSYLTGLVPEGLPVQQVMMGAEPWRLNLWQRRPWRGIRVVDLFWALLAVFGAFLAAELLKLSMPRIAFQLNNHNVAVIFLIACVFIAGRFGLLPGLVASLTSFIVINTHYSPVREFRFDHLGDLVNMLLFLAAAVIVSLFNSYTRAHAAAASEREKRTRLLYRLQRIWSESTSRAEALQALHQAMEEELEVEVAFYLRDAGRLELIEPLRLELNAPSERALQQAWQQMQTTGAGVEKPLTSGWRFIPMVTASDEIGVLAIRAGRDQLRDAAFLRLLHAIADQSALVLERMVLSGLMQESRIREEREKLRALLLSSVSHDLKTPLASIIGGLKLHSSLLARGQLDAATAEELLKTAVGEAERLEQFINNILEMTRLESGEVRFRPEWVNPVDLVLQVQKRLGARLAQHRMRLQPPPQPVLVRLDEFMTEQVMQNLLDNAAKYAPAGTEITVSLQADSKGFRCEVRDQGPGIHIDQQEKVFDKYARLNMADKKIAGTGLGLAICKAIIEAQGGIIGVGQAEGGGAVFWFTLPEVRSGLE